MDVNLDHRPQKQLRRAIPLVVIASVFMALNGFFAKLGSSYINAETMFFWRNVVSLALLLPWIYWESPRISLKEKLTPASGNTHLMRGIFSFLSVFCYYFSLRYLDLTSATLLFFTIPIFIPIVAFVWQGIQIHHRLWWALGLAFLGILLVLQPGSGLFQAASLIALLSGIFGAIAMVALRLGHYSEPSSRILFYLFAINFLLAGLTTLITFKNSWEMLSLSDFSIFLPLGLFGFFYQIFLTFAAKFAPVRLLSPFLYFTILCTALFDYAFFHIAPSFLAIIGFLLIVLGAILMLILYPKDDLHLSK